MERYRQILDNVSDGVYKIDTRGYFTYLNSIALKRTGLSPDRYQSCHYLEMILPEDRELARVNFERVMRGEENPPYELRLWSLDGRTHIREVKSRPIFENGRVVETVEEEDESNNAYRSGIFVSDRENEGPTAEAGPDQRLVHPARVATLRGVVGDDGSRSTSCRRSGAECQGRGRWCSPRRLRPRPRPRSPDRGRTFCGSPPRTRSGALRTR